MATRCCSPADSWSGRWRSLPVRSTSSIDVADAVGGSPRRGSSPAIVNGRPTFSATSSSGMRLKTGRRSRSGRGAAGWPGRRTAGSIDVAVEDDLAAGRPVEPAEQLEERALARAGGAHQRDELAGLDGQRDAAQRVDGGLARAGRTWSGRAPRGSPASASMVVVMVDSAVRRQPPKSPAESADDRLEQPAGRRSVDDAQADPGRCGRSRHAGRDAGEVTVAGGLERRGLVGWVPAARSVAGSARAGRLRRRLRGRPRASGRRCGFGLGLRGAGLEPHLSANRTVHIFLPSEPL